MIRCALLTIASVADPVSDETADAVRSLFRQAHSGLVFVTERQVASVRHLIEEILRRWCDEDEIDLVLTLGGAFPAPGPSSEQITPEATAAVLERGMPSLSEAMRAYAVEEAPEALLDRGVAGIRARTLIINLPGPERLALLFGEAIVDLIEPILARLQPDQESPAVLGVNVQQSAAVSEPERASGLDGDEFASFLAARRNA